MCDLKLVGAPVFFFPTCSSKKDWQQQVHILPWSQSTSSSAQRSGSLFSQRSSESEISSVMLNLEQRTFPLFSNFELSLKPNRVDGASRGLHLPCISKQLSPPPQKKKNLEYHSIIQMTFKCSQSEPIVWDFHFPASFTVKKEKP